ncbi:hypothetical protein HK101_007476 [Irineochytrium annulatum]|nr:hypothetical protein HK101_007476 [Irineochytrium annulatum]
MTDDYGGEILSFAAGLIAQYSSKMDEFTNCTDIYGGINCPSYWAGDANAFDCSVVWTPEALSGHDLSGAYFTSNKDIVTSQIAKGGFRLGKWLDAIADACIAQPNPTPVVTNAGKYFNRTMLILLENVDWYQAATDPYLGGVLQKKGTIYPNYGAVEHPSEPNYIALIAGSTFGILDDKQYDLPASNIADLLEAKGLTWKNYAENYPGGPGNCFTGMSSPDGLYQRKHVPFMSFTSISTNPTRCDNIVNANQLDIDAANNALPNYMFFTPNMNDDGHDTNVPTASAWLKAFLEPKLVDPRYADTLFFITFDENESRTPGNYIYALAVGRGFQGAGQIDPTAYTHYSLLAAVEDNFGLGNLGRNDSTSNKIAFNYMPSNVPPPVFNPNATNGTIVTNACSYPGDAQCLQPSGQSPLFQICIAGSWVSSTCTDTASVAIGKKSNDGKGPAVGGTFGPNTDCFALGTYNAQCLPAGSNSTTPPPTPAVAGLGPCTHNGDSYCLEQDGSGMDFKYCKGGVYLPGTCGVASTAATGVFGANSLCYQSAQYKAACATAKPANYDLGYCNSKYPGDAYCLQGDGNAAEYKYCGLDSQFHLGTCDAAPPTVTGFSLLVNGTFAPGSVCSTGNKFAITCAAPSTASFGTCTKAGSHCLSLPGQGEVVAYCSNSTLYHASCEDSANSGNTVFTGLLDKSAPSSFAVGNQCYQTSVGYAACLPKNPAQPLGPCFHKGDSYCLSVNGALGLNGPNSTEFMYCPAAGGAWVYGSCEDTDPTTLTAVKGVFVLFVFYCRSLDDLDHGDDRPDLERGNFQLKRADVDDDLHRRDDRFDAHHDLHDGGDRADDHRYLDHVHLDNLCYRIDSCVIQLELAHFDDNHHSDVQSTTVAPTSVVYSTDSGSTISSSTTAPSTSNAVTSASSSVSTSVNSTPVAYTTGSVSSSASATETATGIVYTSVSSTASAATSIPVGYSSASSSASAVVTSTPIVYTSVQSSASLSKTSTPAGYSSAASSAAPSNSVVLYSSVSSASPAKTSNQPSYIYTPGVPPPIYGSSAALVTSAASPVATLGYSATPAKIPVVTATPAYGSSPVSTNINYLQSGASSVRGFVSLAMAIAALAVLF